MTDDLRVRPGIPGGSVLRVAYSPDADDAFMYFGIDRDEVARHGLEIRRETADIESLNLRALAGELDVTAISFAAWPRLADRYDLLEVGSSFGLGHGPKLVARTQADLADLAGRRVAIPGDLTTAALLLRLMQPEALTVVVPFDQVGGRVLAGEFDAGLIIHEGQLTFAKDGLCLIRDLGEWWSETTSGLPLPLGANAIRRDLPGPVVKAFKAALRQSIALAQERRAEALAHALRFGRGLDAETGGRYVALYVNELSLDPGERGRRAVEELFARAAAAGLAPAVRPRWA